MTTPWWILGSGAIGSLWAVQLQRAGVDVNIIRSPTRQLRGDSCEVLYEGEHADASDATAEQTDSPSTYLFPQYQAHNCPPTIERLLVCTKAYAVMDALGPLEHALKDDADIVLLVNGMGFHDDVKNKFASQNVFAAVTTAGAWLRAPLHVVPAGDGDTRLGALDDTPAAIAASTRIASELAVTGMSVSASKAIRETLWQKVCINAAINGPTAIYNCRNGALLTHSEARPRLDSIIDELKTLSIAQGMTELAATLETAVHEVIRQTADNYSSTYQDIKQGRQTEIDYINGYVCRLADELNIAAPHSETVLALVRAL